VTILFRSDLVLPAALLVSGATILSFPSGDAVAQGAQVVSQTAAGREDAQRVMRERVIARYRGVAMAADLNRDGTVDAGERRAAVDLHRERQIQAERRYQAQLAAQGLSQPEQATVRSAPGAKAASGAGGK
jgi:hypothetical protein